MKILISDVFHKTNNFVNYLIENYNKKGEKYSFSIYVQDKYDKRFIDKRAKELNNKVLLQHQDGFDIFEIDIYNDFNKLKEIIFDLNSNILIDNNLTEDNFKKEFVNYQLEVFEEQKYLTIDFQFLKI
ncbi:MAG: hypothetical protein JXR51_16015 [Bacteroidales bacterium]|nr:hypothetical protein [Bacteroidales bacterium]MBN2758673.1 hypothetical protein [Bacteroidales bacterium]